MIHRMYMVTPHDSVNSPFVLRESDPVGKLVVMPEYQDLVCKKCRKVDERAALSQGIQERVVVKSKRPFLVSLDCFYLLDERAKQVCSGILPGELDYYRIPSSAFYVASPRMWLQPEETDPGFRFGRDRCKECGRPREVVWGKVPPTIVGLRRFMGINLEGIQGARVFWLMSKEVADELKRASPPLSGISIAPKEVDDGRPVE